MASNNSYSRGLVNYTSRDYNSLVEEFKSLVPKLTSLWYPDADADPGAVLLKILASTADMLGVNLDWLANEVFAPSVSQRKDAEKVFGLIGYTLGWYKAARTEVTFTNNSETPVTLDFGFNGSNFATLTASTDITGQARTITYNILPKTSSYGGSDSRSKRNIITSDIDVFAESDIEVLNRGESCTRVAIEGELRSYSIAVSKIKEQNYVITLPSQHIDTTAIWVKAKSNASATDYLATQWVQCETTAEFIEPEPRYAVTYDNYSNAQITISNYLNQLENYDNNYLVIYWIDCSGVIGCVGKDVLNNLLLAKPTDSYIVGNGQITPSNLSNTVEFPNTYTVTGASPETAREAYYNSRNYINTWNSLVTLPDYNRFLNREAGVDCGVVIDCQKAVEINMAIYNDKNLTDSQKSKMYITKYDFPAGSPIKDWKSVLDLDFDPEDSTKYMFATNFKPYTAMCFAIHNDFKNSEYGQGSSTLAQIAGGTKFIRYKPPQIFIDKVINDYEPLQAMSVEMQFGYARIFKFYVTGQIYTYRPVSSSVGDVIVETAKEALRLYFAPAARKFGEKPTVMEIVNVIESCDEHIKYFDAGSVRTPVINYYDCDPEYFNYISFAKYTDLSSSATNIRIAPECLID
jgi:hypothetical protein